MVQSSGVKKGQEKGLPLWQFDNFPKGQRHFVSGRGGGVSEEPFASLNLSFSAGDKSENVLENRKRIAMAMEIELDKLLFVSQCHSDRFVCIEKGSAFVPGQEADALITNVPGLCICVMGADCVPLLAFDPKKNVVAAIHAGWRGTASGISLKVLEAMRERFGCRPGDMWIGIGPSISQEKYEVGEEVYASFFEQRPEEAKRVFRYDAERNKYYPNLWEANKWQALSLGIPEQQIEIGGICTYSHPEEFFSARYFQNKTGRFAAGIRLEP